MSDSVITILIFAAAFCLTFFMSQSAKKNAHYDEMQLQVRGNAYKISFFTVIFLLLITGFCYEFDTFHLSQYVGIEMVMFTILYISVIVFSVYSILKDAFFSIRNERNSYLVICMLVIAANIPSFIAHIQRGDFFKDRILTFNEGGANILNLVCFLSIFIAILVKKIADKKELEE